MISIIIPAYNAANSIHQCLESVYAEKDIRYEVIVVDDFLSDATLDKLKIFSCKVVKMNTHKGAAAARNTGAEHASGEILLFLDADVSLLPGGLKQTIDFFNKSPDTDIVQGVYANESVIKNLPSIARNYYKCYEIQKLSDGYIYGINSYCFAIKKEAYKHLGGFNPNSEGVEDVEFASRAISYGYKILLNKNLQVQHLKNYTFFGLLKTDYWKVLAKTKLLFRKDNPKITFSLNKAENMVPEITSILVSVFIFFNFVCIIAVKKLIFIYSFTGLSVLFILLNFRFLSFIRKNSSILTSARCLFIFYFELLVSGFAILSGFLLVLSRMITTGKCAAAVLLRYGKKSLFYGKSLPEQVTFFVTDRCNLKCRHCFYRRNLNKYQEEFTLEELGKVTASMGKFSFLSLGGGEPFLRDDLPEIVRLFINNSGVGRISIPTNGFVTAKIVDLTKKILEVSDGKKIIVKISIDAIGIEHDKIRGVAGSFKNAIETFKALKELKKRYNNFRLGVLLTMSKLNENTIRETYTYIRNNLSPDVIGLNFVRGDAVEDSIKDVDVRKYQELYSDILQNLLKDKKDDRFFYKFYSAYKSSIARLIAEIISTNRYPLKCLAGMLSAVMDSSLDVFPCENLNIKMGNPKDYNYDFKKLWFSENSRRIRKYIMNNECRCNCECNLQINSFFSVKKLFSLLIKTTKAGSQFSEASI